MPRVRGGPCSLLDGDAQNLTNRDNLLGRAIADPEYEYTDATGWFVTFPEAHWLPIIPSFGVSYEF